MAMTLYEQSKSKARLRAERDEARKRAKAQWERAEKAEAENRRLSEVVAKLTSGLEAAGSLNRDLDAENARLRELLLAKVQAEAA